MQSTIQSAKDSRTGVAHLALPRLRFFREWLMKLNHSPLRFALFTLSVVLLLAVTAVAQEPTPPGEGINSGNYNIRQTFEFGYRHTDFTGSRNVYNTFVNLNPGPRLLEHTLAMRSLNHQGWLFDDLFVTSFGYGGDPNNITRLRAYKNKWYNFSGTFRRDRNFWDYSLLANPLNPATPVANAPAGFSPVITSSPHRFEITRRMSDFNLTLLPQSRVRFRLGYSRNISEGPSLTSFHEGTDVLLFQPWKTTVNAYQVGVDFKVLPKTNISYDQFLYYYKGDASWVDQNLTFQLGPPPPAAPIPVDLGLIFNTAAGQPCATPFLAPPAPPGTVNPACNGYLSYNRFGPGRTSYPTEQLSFQSSYFKNIDLSGRLVYSSSDGEIANFNESFQGLVTRTRQRQFAVTGPAKQRRVSVSTDFGFTWRVTDKFRIVDMFRFANFRIPGQWLFGETSLFGTSMLVAPNTFVPGPAPPSNCLTITSPGCPQHSSSSPADIISGTSSLFLGQNLKNNLFQLEYDFTKRLGGRLGYRHRHRTIVHRETVAEDLLFFPTLPNRGACAGQPLLPDGSCQVSIEESDADETEINEHSLLFGIWTRPTDALRLSYDMELMSADRSFTRISPRQLQHYKFRASYKPVNWAILGASFNIIENRNNVTEINNLQHNRSYGFSAVFEPNDKFGFDLGYDYNGIFSQTNICFVGTLQPPGSSPCPGAAALFQQNSFYNNTAHFGYFSAMWKPIKRVTTNLGYAVSSTKGETLILNPNAPPGPLAFNYHKPYGGFAVDLTKGFIWKASWNYYGYNEKSVPDPTGARDFRGNMVTTSIRYAF